MDEHFKRGNQYWKKKADGRILMINTKAPGFHYDGDSHIFLMHDQFNQEGATAITEQEFNNIRKEHLKRLSTF